MSSLRDKFPSMPPCNGEWSAIYMEPVIGCGEKITIAVAAVTETERKVTQAIRTEVLECIYGSRHIELQNQISWIVDSATNYIQNYKTLENWESPLSGFTVGEQRPSASKDIDGILMQAVRFSAGLNDLAVLADRDEDRIASPRDHFEKLVKDSVLQHYPTLSQYFNISVPVSSNKQLKTKFNFVTPTYAANFRSFNASRRSQSLSAAKSRIFDLECLREHQGKMFPAQEFELVIGMPAKNDVTISPDARKKVHDHLESLIETADKQQIRVFPAYDLSIAVARVVEKAAA